MQRATRILLLALGAAAGASAASTAAAEASARAWLQAHRVAQPDELAELKIENPQAYAIVKALLTKRSLGLLDPKHPSASFAPAPSHMAPMAAPEAAPMQASAPLEEEPSLSAPMAAAPAQHHDWLSWRPEQSAVDDEALVNSVASASAAAPAIAAYEAPAAAPASQPAAEPAIAAEPVKAAPASDSANPYLNTLGVSTKLRASSAAAAAAASAGAKDSRNYLSSFSWDDSAAKRATPAPVQKVAAKRPKNALLNWLTGNKKAATPEVQRSEDQQPQQAQQAEQAPAAPQQNPYLAALQ